MSDSPIQTPYRIVVLGAGAWGTAIALSLASRSAEQQVSLWTHDAAIAAQLIADRENKLFLPGFSLSDNIRVIADDALISEGDILVSVLPSIFLRPTIARLAPHIRPHQIILSATKGIENQTLMRMTEVIAATLDQHAPHLRGKLAIGALSGPSFAHEVALGLPTAVTVAYDDPAVATCVQQEFSSQTLRLYTSTDIVGVELGGALKNVIAIAAGIVSGVGLGHNSTAGLITRGIAEITRLAVACGGKRETLAGLSGIGDLVLTCTGSLSRNRTVGQELGLGRNLPDILEALGGKVAEGVLTTRAALGLARLHNVEMPITEQMQKILVEGKDPREAIKELMLRPSKDE